MKLSIIDADNLTQIIEPMLKDAKGITAYALAKNLRLLATELREYHDTKMKLFQKYGVQDGDKITIDKNSENYQKFIDEFKMFEKEEVEIDFRILKEDDLKDCNLNGEQIYLLSKYFVE